ncbi:MAG: lipid kinase [Actinomycetota bacterium]
MTTIAVVANQQKSLGGGLPELRKLLSERGFSDPLWYEVPKSKKAPAMARKAVDHGADLLLLCGGDGLVQRCINEVADSGVTIGIMPAGTANLLARNLKIPHDLHAALDVALGGARRRIDVGVINDERFAVMAGIGMDAIMMKEADGDLKDRFGRLAYVWTGARATKKKPPKMKVEIDGRKWFSGRAACVLFGNMGMLGGGLDAFPQARPDDGLLEVGVVTAKDPLQWARVLARLAAGQPERSPYVRMTRGREIDVDIHPGVAFELDGGARKKAKRIQVKVEPGAITVCVPDSARTRP